MNLVEHPLMLLLCWIGNLSLTNSNFIQIAIITISYGFLPDTKKLWVAHAPGMPGTFSPPPWVSDPDMHHGMCVTHMPWCMPGSLTSGFLWSRWRGKRSRHSRRMHNPHFYVSGERPIWTANPCLINKSKKNVVSYLLGGTLYSNILYYEVLTRWSKPSTLTS